MGAPCVQEQRSAPMVGGTSASGTSTAPQDVQCRPSARLEAGHEREVQPLRQRGARLHLAAKGAEWGGRF